MLTASETFRLSAAAAERYEAKFVPALFAEWAPRLVDLAGVAPGQAVLDVVCGTAGRTLRAYALDRATAPATLAALRRALGDR